jgi:hypothetical protein
METQIFTPGIQVKLVGTSEPYRDCAYPIAKDEFLIGRSPECDMVLEATTISGRHARIVRRGDQYELQDLQSTNGTFVGGAKIESHTLRADDRLRFDRYEFRFVNPRDVSRTVIGEAAPRPRAEATAPMPPGGVTQPLPTPTADLPAMGRPAGKTFAGFLLGLLLAYLLGAAAIIAVTLINGAVKLDALLQLLRQTAALHPGMHLYPAWVNANWRDPAAIVVALCLVLGIVLGGLIFQNARRRGRFAAALLLGLGFVVLSLALQAAAVNFRFAALPMLYPAIVPSLGAWGNFALCAASFAAVAILLAWLGALLGRRER